MSKHTLSIFRHLYNHLPPLFPAHTTLAIKQSLEGFEKEAEPDLTRLETEMIKYGYVFWPFHQAHREFIAEAEKTLGDHFLLAYLDEDLKTRYNVFRDYGGDWEELYFGRPIELFATQERAQLFEALVEARIKLREYVDREIKGLSRERYLQRVKEYERLLADIKVEVENLKKMAAAEDDHPALADQINDRIRDIEHSLCLLGKRLRYEEVMESREFFAGRREELERLRGIHLPKKIDFYSMD